MPRGVQLIHVAEGEKVVFIPVIALYAKLREECGAAGAAELQINQRVAYLSSFPASSNSRFLKELLSQHPLPVLVSPGAKRS
jgi:hypothetical protein